MKVRDVVITGLGATTPLGGTIADTWQAVLHGQSAARVLDEPWAADLPVRIAATAAVNPVTVLDPGTARNLDRGQQLALVAADEAWRDAGRPEAEPERIAVVVSTGIGGIGTLLDQADILRTRGARRVSPFTVPRIMPNGPAASVALALGARAGVHAPVSACASGAEAIALGLDLIRAGRADVVVCGGTEAAVAPLPLAAFAAMRALSTRHDAPAAASRPFDKQRDGFVLGEGAAVVVLESADHAAARRQPAHARLAGAGLSNDAHHVAAPDPTGASAARAITAALRDADLGADDVRHVNAHATSTPAGDVAEALALRTGLGAAADSIAVTATKSCTGHLLGAAGALEAAFTVLAMRDGVVPAIRNLDDPDDDVALDLVRVDARSMSIPAALSNSFGFGGHNVALAFAEAR
ncbi:MAG: beta-ketoacyl-[acyl-carrier-protein] synthase family protein [Frankiales bacterium]|nr:beta-ketoacyl-[acyl-carrier-protein] synthase family protein [Frankiales bacterium]